jgi:hypothetical protein
LVPVTNGAIPVAPEGGQSSQAGTLFELERVVVPAAADPPEAGEADVPGPAPAPVPEPPPEEVLAAELLGAVAAVDGGTVVPGNVTAPYGFASVVPEMPGVWAAAGSARTTDNNNAI